MGTDYLSNLPVELLDAIFDQVWFFTLDVLSRECKFIYEQYRSPISKGLLPFTQSRVYSTVIIKSISAFKALCSAVASHPELGLLVFVARFHLQEQYEVEDTVQEEEAASYSSVSIA